MLTDSVKIGSVNLNVLNGELLCEICSLRGLSVGLEDAIVISAAKDTVDQALRCNQKNMMEC